MNSNDELFLPSGYDGSVLVKIQAFTIKWQ